MGCMGRKNELRIVARESCCYKGRGKPSPYPRRSWTLAEDQGGGKPSPYPRRSRTLAEDQGGGKPSPYPRRSPTTTHIGHGPGWALALGILVRIACVFVEWEIMGGWCLPGSIGEKEK